jgi:hypothetical protein
MKKLFSISFMLFMGVALFHASHAQNAITLDPRTTTPTQAKLLVEGTGSVQNIFSYYSPLTERMGIKAVATPNNTDKTSAIVGISDFKIGTPANQTGQTTGVLGFSASQTAAYGVQGISDAQTSGSTSIGVRGYASNVSSNTTNYGGFFASYREGNANSVGYGIYASTYHSNSSGTGNSYGGYFLADGIGISNKVGVFSKVNHYTFGGGPNAIGAYGFQSEITGNFNSEVIGLQANINNSFTSGGGLGSTYGAKFDLVGSAGSANQTGNLYGVQANVKGTYKPSNRYGIYADVEGVTWNNSYGVYARSGIVSDPNVANGLQTYGGYFVATGSSMNQFGIYATADANVGGNNTRFAGYFQGNVIVAGSLSKSSGTFKIDHPQDPENKFLYHSFVESPEMMNVYNGNTTTGPNGEVEVEMPTYFESLNKDFRYQLTVIGQFAQAIVAEEISNNRFKIKTSVPNIRVSWQVTGVRKDVYAEANRVQVEVEKSATEKGKFLHPELYGKDKSAGIASIHPSPSNQ